MMPPSLNFISQAETHGRDVELDMLRQSANHCHDEVRIVLVSGASGTGKSHLVQAFGDEFSSKPNTYFLRVNVDANGGAAPISSLADALSSFCEQFLARESKESINSFRSRFVETMGEDYQLLIQAIPFLKDVIDSGMDRGSKSTSFRAQIGGDADMIAASHRIRYQLISFMCAICSEDRRVILFMDDLQWADSGSLQLLTMLLTDGTLKSLLFIGSYRDNEVDEHHILTIQLDIIRNSGRNLIQIVTPAMSIQVIEAYIAQVLSTNAKKVTSVAEAVFSKTRGNMFHTKTALMVLEQMEILQYSYDSHEWTWDIQRLQSELAISDNIVEITLKSLSGLSPNLQAVLKTASFLPSSFHLSILQHLIKRVQPDESSSIKELTDLCNQLVVQDFFLEEATTSELQRYRFSHDRIREAAHSLVKKQEERELTLRIAKDLIQLMFTELGEQWMFFAGIDHINSLKGINGTKTKGVVIIELVEWNYQAATQAIARSDFTRAADYTRHGLRFMEGLKSPWKLHYDTYLALCNMGAKVHICIGHYHTAETFAVKVFENAINPRHKLECYFSLGGGLANQARHKDALDMYRQALSVLRASLPTRFILLTALVEMNKIKHILKKKSNNDILKIPMMKDPDQKNTVQMIAEMVIRAYFSRETMLSLLCMTRSVLMTLEHGLSPAGAASFAAYGGFLCGPLKNMKLGLRFGELSRQMLKITEGRAYESRVMLHVGVCIDAWIQPLRMTQATLLEAYRAGMETGDCENGFSAAVNYQIHSFMIGIPLKPILDESAHFINRIEQFGNAAVAALAVPLHNLWECLVGRRDVPSMLESTGKLTLLQVKDGVEPSDKARVIWTLIACGIVAYHFQQYAFAEKCWQTMRPHIVGMVSFYTPLLDLYYSGLISTARYRETKKWKYKARAKSDMKRMGALIYKQSSGLNGLHCYQIMIADSAASFGKEKNGKVKDLFERAIKNASRAGFIQDAAIANELCGEYHYLAGDIFWAKHYFTAAYEQLRRWGGEARCDDLFKRRKQCMDLPENYLLSSTQLDSSINMKRSSLSSLLGSNR